jgi:DNA/RNA-binding domain of Phe-tRNA-synthetase-like protein
LQIQVEEHPSLLVRAFVARWRTTLGECPPLTEAAALLSSPVGSRAQLPPPDAAVRSHIRDMLRHRDFKPTGRSKPSSEYLSRASGEGGLRAINAAVDACNAVSLHTGVPISVVDCARVREPLQIRRAGTDESYVFNPTGQVIALAGLVCLYDADGACANAIKDAQRTKTSDTTRTTLSILWSCQQLATQTEAALRLYLSLLKDAADIELVACAPLT